MDKMLSADDRFAIIDLLVRYGTGIDRRDWPLFRSCFTDDFIADYGSFGSWTSGDAMARNSEAAHDKLGATMHRMSNFVMEPSARGASVRSYVDAVLRSLESEGPVSQAAGFYDDVVVNTGAGWKIASRTFTLVRFLQTIDPPSPF